MIRARSARRFSQSSHGANSIRSRHGLAPPARQTSGDHALDGLQRHQLYDAPVPSFSFSTDGGSDRGSIFASPGHTPHPPRTPTIKFGTEEIVHKYQPSGLGSGAPATHERRDVSHRTPSPNPSPNAYNNYNLPAIQESSVEGLPLRQPRPLPAITPSLNTSSLDIPGGPRTAPATVFAPQISHSRTDPFDAPPPATASATTFRLHTDSGYRSNQQQRSISEGGDVDGEAAWRRERGHRVPHLRQTSNRSYPKGEDDKEESVSLVHNPSLESLDDEESRGGIRLVQPSSSSGRF